MKHRLGRTAARIIGVVLLAIAGSGVAVSEAGAAGPTVTVDPATELADRATVRIDWSGFVGGGTFLAVSQCDVAGPPALSCRVLASLTPAPSGTTTVEVSATFRGLDGTDHDCRVSSACMVAVTEFVPDFVSATAPITFAGVPAIGSLSVDPTLDLDDGQSVGVTLTGWSGSDAIEITQCPASGQCVALAAIDAPSDDETVDVVVSQILPNPFGPPFDCKFETTCTVRARSLVGGVVQGDRFVALRFGAFGPFDVAVAPPAPYEDGQTLTLTGEGLVRGLEYSARQCLLFVDTCGDPVPIVRGPDGRFSIPFTVRETIAGVSCRLRGLGCRIVAEGVDGVHVQRRTISLRFTDIPFDVVPSTGLARYQPVRVRSTQIGDSYRIEQCGPANVCTLKARGSASTGFIDRTVNVTRNVGPGFSTDCLRVQCEIRLVIDGVRRESVPIEFADPPARVSVRDSVAYESDGVAFVEVALTRPTSVPVSVTVQTSDGSAVAPDDYAATTTTVVIPVGQRNGYAVIPVVGDGVAEGSEAFTVRIRSVSGAWIDRARAQVTLTDARPTA